MLAAEKFEPLQAADLGDVRVGLVQGMVLENMDGIVAPAYEKALAKLAAAKRADVTLDALGIMTGVNERGGIAPPEAYAINRTLADRGRRRRRSVRARAHHAGGDDDVRRTTSRTCATARRASRG